MIFCGLFFHVICKMQATLMSGYVSCVLHSACQLCGHVTPRPIPSHPSVISFHPHPLQGRFGGRGRGQEDGRRDGRDSGAGADRERQRRERQQMQKKGQWAQNPYFDRNAPRVLLNSSVSVGERGGVRELSGEGIPLHL